MAKPEGLPNLNTNKAEFRKAMEKYIKLVIAPDSTSGNIIRAYSDYPATTNKVGLGGGD